MHRSGTHIITERTLLLDTLSLAGRRPLRHRLADHGHEVPIFGSCEPRKVTKLVRRAKLYCGLLSVVEDLDVRLAQPPKAGTWQTYADIVELHVAGRTEDLTRICEITWAVRAKYPAASGTLGSSGLKRGVRNVGVGDRSRRGSGMWGASNGRTADTDSESRF